MRIRRTAAVARDVISAEPDPALRERTLAFVRAVGRDRSADRCGRAGVRARRAPADDHRPAGPGRLGGWRLARSASTRRPARRGLALLAAAAAVVIAVGIGYAAGGAAKQSDLEASAQEVAILSDAATTAVRIHAQPDAEQVQLVPTSAGGDAAGTLAFSADTGELVAVATGLEPEASNEEYGCWVEVDGTRHRLGPHVLGGRRVDLGRTGRGPRQPAARCHVRRVAQHARRPGRAGPDRQPLGPIVGPAVVRPAGLHAPAAGLAA